MKMRTMMLFNKPFTFKRNMCKGLTFLLIHSFRAAEKAALPVMISNNACSTIKALCGPSCIRKQESTAVLIRLSKTSKTDITRIQQELNFHSPCKISKSLRRNKTQAQGFDFLFHQSTIKLSCHFQM